MKSRPAAMAAALLVACAAFLPDRADAQPDDKPSAPEAREVSDEDKAAARRHFQRGKELHTAGRYREAADEYTEAYQRFPAPAFLYNVAQVYRLAGDRKAAIEHYRKYLELEPDGEGSTDAREFLGALEEAERAEKEAGKGSAPPPPVVEPDIGTAGPIEPIQVRPEPDERDRLANPGRRKKVIGISFAAAGVVGLGVAVGFGLKARSISEELADFEGEWTRTQENRYRDGETAERVTAASAIFGAAALTTGAIIYYLGHRESSRAKRRLELGAASHGDGVVVVVHGLF